MLADKLEKSFKNYVDLVCQNISAQSQKTGPISSKPIFHVIENQILKLREKVKQFAETPIFLDLVENTKSAFSEVEVREIKDVVWISYYKYFHTEVVENYDDWWFCAVYNFFCRSGFYQKILNAIDFNINNLFEQFCLAFRKKEFRTTYIALLEEVDFSGPNMNLNGLQIRKFTEDELEEIFNNEINGMFYPEAYFNNNILLHCWFLAVDDIETASNIIYEYSKYPPKGFVAQKYTNFPAKLETSLRPLLLYDWRPSPPRGNGGAEANRIRDDTPHEFDKFKIPFVLRNDDNLLAFPLKNKLVVELFGPEYVTDHAPGLSHDEKKTEKFKRFLELTKKLIHNAGLNSEKSEYLNIAFGYMTKAFFCEGLDELVFSLIALEALLEEKEEGIRGKLWKRVSIILGSSLNERKRIGKEFKKLHSFRCLYVHGEQIRQKVCEDHLRKARELIREGFLWYLICLNLFKDRGKEIPPRSEIIKLIDSEDNIISAVRTLLRSFMKEFS